MLRIVYCRSNIAKVYFCFNPRNGYSKKMRKGVLLHQSLPSCQCERSKYNTPTTNALYFFTHSLQQPPIIECIFSYF
jgi:hypothetical protein